MQMVNDLSGGAGSGLLPGVISVVQTPFGLQGEVDEASLRRLVEEAIQGGVNGLLVPAVASEVAYLSLEEREEIIRTVVQETAGRVPIMVGASAEEVDECRHYYRLAEEVEAAAVLVAVPDGLYSEPEKLVSYFEEVAAEQRVPLMIQDLQWNGPGLTEECLVRLKDSLPNLMGIKIETVPAGPKYTQVRDLFGEDFFICGGWAVPQWIEAMDRGVDAIIPESSMIRVYAAILRCYQQGDRERAVELFRKLLCILAYTNQEIATSVAFFKRLLVRRGVFAAETMRLPGFSWDAFNSRIAEELIGLYFDLEQEIERLASS